MTLRLHSRRSWESDRATRKPETGDRNRGLLLRLVRIKRIPKPPMKMKTILRGALLLVVNLAASALVLAADSRPNFLFVFTDDQRWDAMGVVQREQGERARFPWLQTPNMDRLAAEGVR